VAIFTNESGSISKSAKKVIMKMVMWKVPLMPENYHVWFEYFTGANKQLKEEIDGVMASGSPFTTEINNQLYSKHFGNNKDNEFIQQVQTETQNIIKGIFEEVMKSHSTTTEYLGTLETYTKQLTEAKDISQVQSVIKDIINDTDRMAETTHEFENRLKEVDKQTQDLRFRLQMSERETLMDPLTELHNRRALNEKLKDLFSNYIDHGMPFSIIMLDIDHFKKFNDTYGHKVGDDVLKLIAKTLCETIKGSDFPARFGGEEFTVLLPDTSLDNACIVADHIRKNVCGRTLTLVRAGSGSCEELGNITVSLGVAEIRQHDTVDDVMERSDKALYLAKNSGRNMYKSEKEL
jgi:diguanylate cyclase